MIRRAIWRQGFAVTSGLLRSRRRPYERVVGWSAKRARQLRWEPICQYVTAAGVRCSRRATDVDHVVPLSRGGTDEPSNYQSLCHNHHSSKTATEFDFAGVRRRRHR